MRAFQDLRYGLRLLLRRPGFALAAILTLALGTGALTATVSALDTMNAQVCPGAADSSRLVELETLSPEGNSVRGSYRDYRQHRDLLKTIAGVAARNDVTFSPGLGALAQPVRGEQVRGNYFDVLQLRPAQGRLFSPREEPDKPGTNPVAVIGYQLWQRQFQMNPQVVGRTLRVSRHELKLVGVTPEGSRGSVPNQSSNLFVPITLGLTLGMMETDTFRDPGVRNIYAFARLRRGADLEQARAEAQVAVR